MCVCEVLSAGWGGPFQIDFLAFVMYWGLVGYPHLLQYHIRGHFTIIPVITLSCCIIAGWVHMASNMKEYMSCCKVYAIKVLHYNTREVGCVHVLCCQTGFLST